MPAMPRCHADDNPNPGFNSNFSYGLKIEDMPRDGNTARAPVSLNGEQVATATTQCATSPAPGATLKVRLTGC